MGIKATLVYMSGCYHGKYHQGQDGTTVEVWCTPGCDICQGRITIGKIGTDGNGNTSVLDYTEQINDQQFGGVIARHTDGNNLILGVDQKLMTSTTYNSLFAGDVLTLHSPFALNQDVANVLNLDVNHRVIPTGSYELNIDGNIIWWTVPIASLGAPNNF